MLTGESKPIIKNIDSHVIGGSINQDGSLQIHVEKTKKQSYLSQIINLVKKASENKSRLQSIADKAAL
jgi:Cu2+-exporting ATPase